MVHTPNTQVIPPHPLPGTMLTKRGSCHSTSPLRRHSQIVMDARHSNGPCNVSPSTTCSHVTRWPDFWMLPGSPGWRTFDKGKAEGRAGHDAEKDVDENEAHGCGLWGWDGHDEPRKALG